MARLRRAGARAVRLLSRPRRLVTRLWAAYAARLPSVEDLRAIAKREIPIFVLEPVR